MVFRTRLTLVDCSSPWLRSLLLAQKNWRQTTKIGAIPRPRYTTNTMVDIEWDSNNTYNGCYGLGSSVALVEPVS